MRRGPVLLVRADSDSHAPMPQPGQPWDWFHINAVHLDTDGNLLISSRFTWTIYKVNLRTGAIMWQLGGKHSTFAVKAEPGQKLDNAGENQPEGLTAGATGSAQTTKNFSEFSPSGKLLFNARLPDGTGTYRAYRLRWNPDS